MKRQSGLLEEILELQENVMNDNKMKDCLNYLEDSMARQFDMTTVVRLMSLYSLMQDGLADKEFKSLSKLFLQAYGYRHVATLHCLERLQLFSVKESKKLHSFLLEEPLLPEKLFHAPEKSSFRKICRKLNLLPEEKNGENHPSYVFGGVYTPLIYKLVDNCLKEKDNPSLDDFVRCYGNDLRSNSHNNPHWNRPGRILVMVIGGVTLAEVAALNLLGRQLGRQIIVAATSTISGNSLVQTISSSNDT